jgi:hypothetical protein
MNLENTYPDITRSGDDESRTIPVEYIERRIYPVRERNIMLDSDLADLYQVTTGNLNLAVRRNRTRFPADFMLQLTKEEGASLLLQSARAKKGRGGRQTPPYAFTELGVATPRSGAENYQPVKGLARRSLYVDSSGVDIIMPCKIYSK